MTEFRAFITAFDARVASHVVSNRDRLYYLDQHLSGEPKEMIEGCMYMHADDGYQQARYLLKKEYGDPYKVSRVYLNKVQNWPAIKPNDCVALKKFSIFLRKCGNAMSSLSYLCVLDNPPNMFSVVQKLPNFLQNKWCEHVSKMRTHKS